MRKVLSNSLFIAFIVITIFTLALYSPTLNFPFQFDDYGEIVNNDAVKNINLGVIWNHLPTRFVLYVTFALNYYFFGLNTLGFHIINIFFHIISGFFVFLFISNTIGLAENAPSMNKMRKLPLSINTISLFTALLFVSHPLQTGTVTYIIQRAEGLSSMVYLISIVCFIYARRRYEVNGESFYERGHLIYYFFSILAVILGMFTKEIFFTLPVMLLIYDLFFFNKSSMSKKKRILYHLPYLLTLPIIPILLLTYNKSLYQYQAFSQNRWDYFLTQSHVIWTYIRLSVWPVNQNLDYDYTVYSSIWDPFTLISVLSLLGLFFFSFYLYHIKYRLQSFFILWFFIIISVTSSVIPNRELIFEHRMYLPLLGVLFLLFFEAILLISRFLKKGEKLSAIVFFFIIILFFSIETINRNMVWKDALSLWSDSASKSPKKDRPIMNVGISLSELGRLEEAKIALKKAIRLNPKNFKAHYNLAIVYEKENKLLDAKLEYSKSIALNSGFSDAIYNFAIIHHKLGNKYLNEGKVNSAIYYYKESLRFNPELYPSRLQLNRIYKKIGENIKGASNG